MNKKDFLRSITIMILFNIYMVLNTFFSLNMNIFKWIFFSVAVFFFLTPLNFLNKYKHQNLSFIEVSMYYLLILVFTSIMIFLLSHY